MPSREFDRLADHMAKVASHGGHAILNVYGRDFTVHEKQDRSPVTEADDAAEAIILAGLRQLLPGMPIVAEEAVSRGEVPPIGRAFLLVDPLDGTREFAARNDEFTVNIALVEDGVPVAGIVYAPALRRLYLGGETARRAALVAGAVFDPSSAGSIRTRAPDARALVAAVSRSHQCDATRAWLAVHAIKHSISGGSALKFGLVAEGSADVYPRFGPTAEWDTAAGHAIVRAAGGDVVTPDGGPFLYGKRGSAFLNGPFIAWGQRPER
jgi:3'(2'), 5'-bisphosphate nucleotidase